MKRARGFTLIEVLVAVFLLTLISIAGFEFFRYCHKFAFDAENRLIALNSARETMEELYWDPALAVTADPIEDPLPDGPLRDLRNGDRTYLITDDQTPDPDYKIVAVTVTWD